MQAIINKNAHFSYEILDAFEAGLVLLGHEVKSIKSGQMSLKGAYISLTHEPKPELFLVNAHVSPYKNAGPLPDYVPTRPRKLLLDKRTINSLIGKLEQKGLTIIPLKVYTKRNLVKIEIGLARGKKLYEKKESIKKRDVDREIRRTLKEQ